ncbi:hypothetical protein CVS47_00276 [Microbacterium lemovicicum]|jgi:hypothetical protein|uniref:YtxH domain-containing protein n=1 Tax=Microbacterium lemovicicum TaxID=1072463 RepID=A0A3Q9IW22_9MICO|nr:hypothetical protein [Microbacterium lemovicicum]AZS35681.1 hypothetical protein CVS47_00276 [Microbacterium lemovicicum]
MRNKLLLIGGVVFLAYVLGSRAGKGESLAHQLVREWNDPKARKRRHKAYEKSSKALEKSAKDAKKKLHKLAGS